MEKKPTMLPLVISAATFIPSNPEFDESDAPGIVTVQMNTLGGDVYLLPMDVTAATDLLACLSLWKPAMGVIKSGVLPERRKLDN